MHHFLTLIITIALSLFVNLTYSNTVIQLDKGVPEDLTKVIYFYTDSSNQKTLKEIISEPDFKNILSETPNFSYSDYSHWFKFSYQSQQPYYLQIKNSLLDSVEIYFIQNKRIIKKILTGDWRKFHNREYLTPEFLFKLPKTNNSLIDVYIKTRTEISHLVPIKLYSEKELIQSLQGTSIIRGLFYGAILIMFFFNLFLFIGLKDRSYLFYILFLLFYALSLLTFDGFLYKYLFSNYPWWNSIQLYVYVYLATFFGGLFSISYLNLKTRFKKGYKVLRVTVILTFFLVLLTFIYPNFFFHDLFSSIYSSLASIIGLVIGIISWKRSFKPAKYFVTAYGLVLASVVIFTLKELDVFGSNFITDNVLYLGSSLEMMFLSLGLSSKYNLLKEKNERSHKRIIKNLEEIQIIKSEANISLERKVKERTNELNKQKQIIEEKNKNITDSINYARRIQKAILPSEKLFKEQFATSFIFYNPKDIVAGDFYWMHDHPSDENIVFLAAADCTGHGVPGAMVSVVCNNGLNRSIREHGLSDPGAILSKTRELILQEFEKSEENVHDGMDIALCSFNVKTLELQYAGAYNPLWVIRKNVDSIEEIKANIQPIGKSYYPEPFITHSIPLKKDDSFYIFSDGYVDQFGGEKGKKFKLKAFKKLLISIQGKSMKEQKMLIENTFENWKGDLEQIDDVCIIGVRI